MTNCALQQSSSFTHALMAMGAAAGNCDINGRAVQFIDRGPIRYFARPPAEVPVRALRGRYFTVLNAENSACLGGAGYARIMTGGTVALLDLDRPFAPRQKWRNALTKARAINTKISHRGLNVHDGWIFEADSAQQRAKRFRALPHFISQNWPRKLTMLSVAWSGSDPIAAMLFLIHGGGATYQIGWSGADGRRVNAHHRLLAEAIPRLTHRGVSQLDLGAVDTHSAPGLARFKIGTGAEILRLGGTWIAPPLLRR